MGYCFDKIVDRRGSGAIMTDCLQERYGRKDLIPLWIADMNFETPEPIRKALEKRLDHQIYGYSVAPESYWMSILDWERRTHGWVISRETLTFIPGIVRGIAFVLRCFTDPGDKVVVQPPVYMPFLNLPRANNRQLVYNPLVFDEAEGMYRMDLDNLELVCLTEKPKVLILSNPHNPAGRIWSRAELETLGDLCFKHGVLVLSDEIHCDITDPGVSYTPFASVSEHCRDNSIMAMAPTKCFNIAGIQSAAAMASDPTLCRRIRKALESDSVAEPNAFAVAATIAAFEHCGPWLDEMRSYVFENKQTVLSFVEKYIPELHVVPSEATYLLWLDCSAYMSGFSDSDALAKEIRRRTGLFLSNGIQYGEPGSRFLRMNIACPRTLLLDGLDRLAKALSGIRETAS